MEPTVLSSEHREHYFEHGFLVMPGMLSDDWLDRLNAVTREVVAQSAHYTRDDVRPLGQRGEDPLADKLMLADGHTAAEPMLTRLSAPVDVHGECSF